MRLSSFPDNGDESILEDMAASEKARERGNALYKAGNLPEGTSPAQYTIS
jgi:hypothetical protein